MAKINIKEFNSWNKLSEFIDETFTYFNGFSFRGHADADWKLESTLKRAINRKKSNSDFKVTVNNHLQSFKQNLRGRSKFEINKIAENEILAIGQHFGLYTPLLDLSESPYVALFFALQGKSDSGKRCIWAFSDNIMNDIKANSTKYSSEVEIIKPISNDNPRLVSQQGLFVKIPVEKSFEEIISETESTSKGVSTFKIVFDDKIANHALASLNNMNINNLTLFPDLIGSSLHANYIFDTEEYLENKRSEIWKEHNSRQ